MGNKSTGRLKLTHYRKKSSLQCLSRHTEWPNTVIWPLPASAAYFGLATTLRVPGIRPTECLADETVNAYAL